MKKLLSFLLFLVVVQTMNAVPAKPGVWRLLKLTDGTEVHAQLAGDEHVHFWLAEDGTKYEETATDGVFAPLSERAIQARSMARRNVASKASKRLLSPRRVVIGERTHYTGSKKGLVVLAQYTDIKFNSSNNLETFNKLLNNENYQEGSFRGSVADYFKAQSAGQFELHFDVVGPFTLRHNRSFYGTNDSEGNDMRADSMIVEACMQADSLVDFHDYDWDGDGEADQVFVVYAGRGEADGGGRNTIWPHMYWLEETGADIVLDDVRINTYACSSELMGYSMAGIGTFCHEFSHCLGFPDFYDTGYSGWLGMGSFDLMASGNYNGNGFLPAGYTAHEKMMCGWQEPTVLAKNDTIVENVQPMSNNGETFIIYNDAFPDEYYMLENRQPTGFDAGYPSDYYGHTARGLMITHVDFDHELWEFNVPNSKLSESEAAYYELTHGNDHQRMTLFRADNTASSYTEATDLFPYNTKDSLTATSRPAATLYNNNSMGTKVMQAAILNITQNSDGTVSFTYRSGVKDTTPGEPQDSTEVEPDDEDGVLFYESFDQCSGTGGNDGLWNGSIASSSFVPDNDGWKAETLTSKMYGANQCARFGSNQVAGIVATPAFNLKDMALATFKAAAWDASSENTLLQIEAYYDDAPTRSCSVEPSEIEIGKGEWTECSINIKKNNAYGNGRIRLSMGTGNRIFLDEVLVVTTSANEAILTHDDTKAAPERIYSIDGRMVGTTPGVLPHGLYIVNGKKIIK